MGRQPKSAKLKREALKGVTEELKGDRDASMCHRNTFKYNGEELKENRGASMFIQNETH